MRISAYVTCGLILAAALVATVVMVTRTSEAANRPGLTTPAVKPSR